jgi:hypothetical protein
MRLRTFAALIAVLLFAGPARAQEQRATMDGIVKDNTGAVLPGATVEAKSETGATLSTVSDDTGQFRFPAIAPGTYVVTAKLTGFRAAEVKDVRVGLGQSRRLEFTMAIATLAETVQVTSESPLVDVRQAARQVNIRAEQVELLPHGRDFTTLVTQAPGANNEAKLGGLSIDGASAGENRYIIDGVETTDLQDGTSGKNLIADFVEEVQVKSSGYTAENPGATGGVISVLTKSGTNNWRGSALFNYQGSALEGERTPTLRISLTDVNRAEYINYPKDESSRVEPAFALGGPIAINKLWFFGAYQPAITETSREVNASTSSNPAALGNAATQKAQVQYALANITSQLSDGVKARISYNNSWSKTKGLLPALNGTDRPSFGQTAVDYTKTSIFPNYTISGNLDWTVSPKLFFGARGGYYMSDQHDSNVTKQPLYRSSTTSSVGLLDVPVNLQMPAGFTSIPSNTEVVRDQQTRAELNLDGTWFATGAGEHQIKFGVQTYRIGNDVLSGESRPRVTLAWNRQLTVGGVANRGPYGYYVVRSNGADPTRGFVTEGKIHSNTVGLFVQDAWTMKNLTINAGLRTERERVPTYTSGEDIPEFGLEFGFADKIAPRVGVAYDVLGNGRTKAFGSWGVFYDVFKLELPRGSFGGDKWLDYNYTLDTFNWPTLIDAPGCPPACPGRLISGPIDFRHPSFGSDAIEPDLKPMRMQEATAGIEHEINNRLAASLRYVHKQVDRAIEDTGSLDAAGNEIYIIANPGEGLTALAFTNPNVALPKAVRDYDSVEFALEKRLANNWYLRSSYLWSRLWGNYSGLSQSDENGRTSPNVGRLFDYPLMMFQDGGVAAYGPLATDRPHQFKTQFIYQMPFGTTFSVNEYIASGLPVSRELGIYPTSNLPVQYLGRGSDGRTPTYSQTDFFIQHEFKLGSRALQANFTVFNLFNQDTAIGRYSTYQAVNGVVPDEALFYTGKQTLAQLITEQGVTKDPRFLMDNAFQAPITARFGLRFVF